ncbi:MAG: DUF2490 domain-containing protein [Bacteroidales bacterium]|nr:DUF2490 domain-containing protein [Bacteroidales bacterium]
MKDNPYIKAAGPGSRIGVSLLLILLTNLLGAQDLKVVRDLHLWTGATIEKKVGKDWVLSLEEEIRFKHNISEINNYHTGLGLRYRINKNFALEGGYRYTRDKKSDRSFENLTRYHLDLRYAGRMNPVSITYRLRYQKEVEGFRLMDQRIDYEKYVRQRIRIRYENFARVEPFVSLEIFQLFRPDYNARFYYFCLLGGIKYEPGKLGSLGFAYGFYHEIEELEPAMNFLFKVNYTYRF